MGISSQKRRMLRLAAIPSIIFFLSALLLWPFVAIGQSDVKLYLRYADLIMQGGVPYHTFPLEYPPLALVPMLLPRLLSFGFPMTITVYWFLLLCENTLWVYLLTLLGCRFATLLGEDHRGVVVTMGVLAPIIASNLPWRFDLFPALLTALALLAVCSARPIVGGAWFGAGVAAKLYPAVIAPPLFVRSLIWRRWGDATRFACGLVLIGTLACAPFLLVDPAGFLQVFRYHEMRGIQVDSVAAGGIFVGKLLGLTTLDVKLTYGSFNMISPWADAVLPWLMPIFVVSYGLMMGFVAWTELRLYARRVQGDVYGREIVFVCRYALISILLFIVTNKVYSLQYVAWIIPFVFLFSRSEKGLFLCIVSISMFLYPNYYGRLTDGDLSAVILLNIKNIATILLLILSIIAVWRCRGVTDVAAKQAH